MDLQQKINSIEKTQSLIIISLWVGLWCNHITVFRNLMWVLWLVIAKSFQYLVTNIINIFGVCVR